MFRKVSALVVVALSAFILSSADGGPRGERSGRGGGFRGPRFKTELVGAQEVPPVSTKTSGRFEIRFNSDLTEASFDLRVRDGIKITQAHLHCGEFGENGPVVVFLFGMVPGGFDVDGDLAEFVITNGNVAAVASNCMNAIGRQITSVAELAQAMTEGLIYANVHSVANPGGVIRGQLGDDVSDGGGDDDGGDGGDHDH